MKTNLDSLFKTDKNLETEGVWFAVSPEVSFLLRRFGGSNIKKVDAASTKYQKPHIRLIQAKALSKEKEDEILAKVFAEACLVDWKGVAVDGQELPCTFENGVKLLTSLPELFETLFRYCAEVESFKEDLGNS